jgi:hypothetical protein
MKTRFVKLLSVKTLLVLLPLLLAGCESWLEKQQNRPKPEPQLPPETQEGKHTLGCLLNGQIWVPGGAPSPATVGGISAYYDGGYFYVTAAQLNDQIDQGFAVHVTEGVTKPGIYPLSNDLKGYLYFYDSDRECTYGQDSLPQIGELEITKIDTKKYFVSGRFWFTLVQPGCDTIRVTDGRFDVKYGW